MTSQQAAHAVRALQIFTQAIGSEDGYIPSLGAPATRKALEEMQAAGVPFVFHGRGPETGLRELLELHQPEAGVDPRAVCLCYHRAEVHLMNTDRGNQRCHILDCRCPQFVERK